MANMDTGEIRPFKDLNEEELASGKWKAVEDLIRKEKASNVDDLLEAAWGIIANAGGGDWTRESADWQEAAARWRTDYFARLNAAKATK